jgi:amino acid adenylation domain-containing protein
MAIGRTEGAELNQAKAELSEEKRRLLQQRMLGMARGKESDLIRPRPEGSRVSLSAEQRRVWLHASQQPDVPIYNEPFTIHRYGSFDLGILEASINEILRRHESLRTGFSPEGEEVIQATARVTLPLVDLSGLPETEREAEALRIATEDAQKPIPLHTVPLFRARVVRMKADEHRLYITLHHIIFDGVSIARIFAPELTAIYASLEAGTPSPLPLPALQYGDYAIWRERHVDSPEVKQHLAYWLEHLSGELPVLHLPTDRTRSAITSYRGSMECFQVPAELVEGVRGLSRLQGATPYMILLAAFKVLLFRYSGQNDIVVGSATDARRRPELEHVMGYFLDTFAIRSRPAAELRFTEFLAQIRDSVLGGLSAADVPFDHVVKAINPRRDAGQHPIFQSFFTIRPPMPPLPDGWDLTQTDVTVGTSKFDLYLELGERPDRMEGRFFFSTDIWDRSTIKRMAANWLVLLQSICRNPESTLRDLQILTAEEMANLVGAGGWNDTATAFPQATLNTLFEDQVRRSPSVLAAVFGNESWTYEQLNSRADAIASMLRAAAVTRGSIVAILLDRSLDMLAGLIAVLKTGAAYLPLDLQMPRERIALCIADAQPSAILTQRSLSGQIESKACSIVLVDGNRENESSLAMNPTPARPTPIAGDLEDTAYLIYTSGTTGEPKGVEISQRSLVNLLAAMQTAPGFGPEDVLLAVTPISFDIAALELFLPLICGGQVVIASREEAHDPYPLASAISRSRCTVMQATPATWRTLLLSGWESALLHSTDNQSIKLRVLCGGEALPRELSSRLLATGAELWNMYGPTETTIWSMVHHVETGTGLETGPISVGRPIANTQAYILDAQRQQLPIGVPGELYLGGVGLAKGYRGQPELTADRFIAVESAGGARLYRTGDVAVRRADGTIEVLGRKDNQVKVRGNRIELEAVESAILRHPQVAAAAAQAWPEVTGELRLSAYVVIAGGNSPLTLADMREFLGKSLQDYMIPSDLIVLPELPLTAHGKVDRARLPAPSVREDLPQNAELHSSEEVRLAAIWAELLGQKHVRSDDNFFDLGGHSLLVAALQQRIAKEFGRRISIVELFQGPTVRQQAELMRGYVSDLPALPPGVHALQPYGTRNSIFWVHYLNMRLSEEFGKDQPFLSVGLTEEDVASLGEAPNVKSIAYRFLLKILAVQPQGPYTVGGLCLGGILAYEVAFQLQAAGHEVSILVMLDAPNPSYLGSRDSLSWKFSYICYCLKRAWRLGMRTSWVYFREHLAKHPRRTAITRTPQLATRAAQEMIEAAVSEYHPDRYNGDVLLVLASERPPHMDFLPGWQAVISHNLHVRYVDGHHRDLLDPQNVRNVADAIVSFLRPAPGDPKPKA